MTLRIPADRATVERAVEQERDVFFGITERSKTAGAIHHSFYADGNEVLVIDEWPNPESFQAFFEAEGENIGKLLAAAGIEGPSGPPVFYDKLELGDEF